MNPCLNYLYFAVFPEVLVEITAYCRRWGFSHLSHESDVKETKAPLFGHNKISRKSYLMNLTLIKSLICHCMFILPSYKKLLKLLHFKQSILLPLLHFLLYTYYPLLCYCARASARKSRIKCVNILHSFFFLLPF